MAESEKSLNREIAELLGWTVKSKHSVAFPSRDVYTCFRPDGTEANYYYEASAEAAWKHVPDYEHCLDAVMAANDAPNASLCISRRSPLVNDARQAVWYADINFYDADRVITGTGDTPQQAAARALLAYVQWKRDDRT